MAVQNSLFNGNFEEGDTGWSYADPGTGTVSIVQDPANAFDGSWAMAVLGDTSEPGVGFSAVNLNRVPVYAGQVVNASAKIKVNSSDASNAGFVNLFWYKNKTDGDAQILQQDIGSKITREGGTNYRTSAVSGTAPVDGWLDLRLGGGGPDATSAIYIDSVEWDYVYGRTAEITSPNEGDVFTDTDVVSLSVSINSNNATVSSVEYFDGTTSLGSTTASPYTLTTDALTLGAHEISAVVTFTDTSSVETEKVSIEVGLAGSDREFKASNAYTYFILESIAGISSSMPATAAVTGVEVIVDYKMDILARAKNIGVVDPTLATKDVVFDITDGGEIELVMLSHDEASYSQIGTPITERVAIDRADFTLSEQGISEGKGWGVFTGTASSSTLGGEAELFGDSRIFASDFKSRAFGVRFYPNLANKPSYADSGDACFRFFVDKVRIRVYFDAGSVEYYFASPDKTQVLKGELVSADVLDGDLTTADASGVLQIQPILEIMDGTQRYIANTWTIHAAYPPTNENQIGTVGDVASASDEGMEYNGLPTQQQVTDNRSRYEFITENFFGSKDLDSIYGVHGLPRAFAYNTEFFYKIYTQADPLKDKPRHVANHHYHLALGYEEGRVDTSVVGEPWNFDGSQGAASRGIGDRIVGLLPLSGTMLGIFCSKSIWGMTGTTVDNFATQVISPNMGAIEYTITDIGSPTYANSYGIYTLSQTQQYGDYLGNPMSQEISPWLRPRLVRKYTSDKEVVCAWPVRSKNQYRLAFSDGYVLSMTLNGQAVPTFSQQKYFYQPNESFPYFDEDMYSYPSIVPAAVSSQLDESGEERIHMAPYIYIYSIEEDFDESGGGPA